MKKFLLILCGFLSISGVRARDFSYSTSIEFPPNATIDTVKINNSNYTVGSYALFDNFLNRVRRHGFVFSQGTLLLNQDYPGSESTILKSVNNSGVAVGMTTIWDMLQNTLVTHGVIMDADGFRLLDYPDAVETYLSVINNNGLIAGEYITPFRQKGFFTYNTRTGRFRDIQARFGGSTNLDSINNNGIISGTTNNTSKAFRFRSSNNQLTIFQTPDRAITAHLSPGGNPRVIAGTYRDPLAGQRGYLFRNGRLTNISPPGAALSEVAGINNNNQLALDADIPGIGPGTGTQSFQYDLRTREYSMLNPNQGGQAFATSINANGNIAGYTIGVTPRVYIAFPQ